ncbi:MAG: ParB/RepB/Spo0J family partition protein, partial [Planctomycetota bacterium]
MHTRQPKQTIVSLPIRKLHSHPANANRMSKAKFAKLTRHIERTGHYEPVVVRRHPSKENAYQILNGHHRVRAMKQLGASRIDCVVFDADDEQARIYLLSLNRLAGRDNVYKKAKLIEQLCRSHSSRDLAKLLGDPKTAIEKLNALSQNQPLSKATDEKPFLLP